MSLHATAPGFDAAATNEAGPCPLGSHPLVSRPLVSHPLGSRQPVTNPRLEAIKARLHGGLPLRAAFLGGSVTWGGNCSDNEEYSYRARVIRWLRGRYPDSHVMGINASLGGTGSDLGACRLQKHVLQFQPDLVFVEFAVNDNEKPYTHEPVEGILRQLLCANIAPVLVISAWEKGPLRLDHFLELARHYDLPLANIHEFVHNEMRRGAFAWSEYAGDQVHPNDRGHEIMAGRVIALLEEQFDAEDTADHRPLDETCTLPLPLSSNRFETATLVSPDKIRVLNGWETEKPDVGEWIGTIPNAPLADGGIWPWPFHDGYLRADTVGADFEITFRGTFIGLHADYSQGSGILRIEIDGREIDIFKLDPGAEGDRIPIAYRIWHGDWENADHVLRVTLDAVPEGVAPRFGRARVGYVLVGQSA